MRESSATCGRLGRSVIHDNVSDFQVIYGSLSNSLHLFPSFGNCYSDRIENLSRQNRSNNDNFHQTKFSNLTISGQEVKRLVR